MWSQHNTTPWNTTISLVTIFFLSTKQQLNIKGLLKRKWIIIKYWLIKQSFISVKKVEILPLHSSGYDLQMNQQSFYLKNVSVLQQSVEVLEQQETHSPWHRHRHKVDKNRGGGVISWQMSEWKRGRERAREGCAFQTKHTLSFDWLDHSLHVVEAARVSTCSCRRISYSFFF